MLLNRDTENLLMCCSADVPLRNYSLTHSLFRNIATICTANRNNGVWALTSRQAGNVKRLKVQTYRHL